MEERNLLLERSNILPAIFAVLSAILFVLVLAGVKLPFIEDFRGGLIALSILGVLMAITGFKETESTTTDGFSNGFVIISSIVGVLSFIVVVAALFGIDLPLIPTEKEAFISLGILMLIGWVTTTAHHMINRDDLYLNA